MSDRSVLEIFDNLIDVACRLNAGERAVNRLVAEAERAREVIVELTRAEAEYDMAATSPVVDTWDMCEYSRISKARKDALANFNGKG